MVLQCFALFGKQFLIFYNDLIFHNFEVINKLFYAIFQKYSNSACKLNTIYTQLFVLKCY